MQIYTLIIDDFLSDFAAARAWADNADYRDIRSPVDDVTYPHIAELPDWLAFAVETRLESVMSSAIRMQAFARMSPAGVHCPNVAHNDAAMGQWSLMLYLNRPEHCRGGTSLLRHESGFEIPETETDADLARECANMPQCWSVTMTCPMRANRAFIFPAGLMHRAEPAGGFGKDRKDARLVLTAFFDLVHA